MQTMKLEWDEAKRRRNLRRHGLDFAQARAVLESRWRLDLPDTRSGELRGRSVSYVLGLLAVLTVLHTARGDTVRIVSFRRASREEREAYDAWLEEAAEDNE